MIIIKTHFGQLETKTKNTNEDFGTQPSTIGTLKGVPNQLHSLPQYRLYFRHNSRCYLGL